MDSLDIKFAALIVLLVLLLGYVIGVPRTNISPSGNADKEIPKPYVYPTEYIENLERSFSITNFSGLSSDKSIKPTVKGIFLELNESRCAGEGKKNYFYKVGIYTLRPTLMDASYKLIECKRISGNLTLARKTLESLLLEINERESQEGLSPWFAVSEWYITQEISQYSTSKDVHNISAFDLEYLVPFIRDHLNDTAKNVPFELSNITRTKEELTPLKKSMENEMDYRSELLETGMWWLNLSESAYKEGKKSLALWYYSLGSAYKQVAESNWARAPLPASGAYQIKKDVPYNITGLRTHVYQEALNLAPNLNGKSYAELFSNFALLNLWDVEEHILPKLADAEDPKVGLYPSTVYSQYLQILAEVRAVEIFGSYFS
jgi:hypothetical protein